MSRTVIASSALLAALVLTSAAELLALPYIAVLAPTKIGVVAWAVLLFALVFPPTLGLCLLIGEKIAERWLSRQASNLQPSR